MSRRGKGRNVNGVVLLDKPAGYSSSQAVQKVRWLFQARKAGHTGSLDPFATGMLPICLGEASKTAGFMLDASKTYVARAVLGQATTTGDVEGEVSAIAPVPVLSADEVRSVLSRFEGVIKQIPPMYSAIKHQGQPLYRLARAGQDIPRAAREVTIHSLELLTWKPPLFEFRAHCSKGTYLRTLAEDIAAAMTSRAHLQALRRLAVEPFCASDMVALETLESMAQDGCIERCLLPPDAGLQHWPELLLDDAGALRFSHGNPVGGLQAPPGEVRVYGPGKGLLGLGEVTVQGVLKAKRVMHIAASEPHK